MPLLLRRQSVRRSVTANWRQRPLASTRTKRGAHGGVEKRCGRDNMLSGTLDLGHWPWVWRSPCGLLKFRRQGRTSLEQKVSKNDEMIEIVIRGDDSFSVCINF